MPTIAPPESKVGDSRGALPAVKSGKIVRLHLPSNSAAFLTPGASAQSDMIKQWTAATNDPFFSCAAAHHTLPPARHTPSVLLLQLRVLSAQDGGGRREAPQVHRQHGEAAAAVHRLHLARTAPATVAPRHRMPSSAHSAAHRR